MNSETKKIALLDHIHHAIFNGINETQKEYTFDNIAYLIINDLRLSVKNTHVVFILEDTYIIIDVIDKNNDKSSHGINYENIDNISIKLEEGKKE